MRLLPLCALALAALAVPPGATAGPDPPDGTNAKTNKGGSCRLESITVRAGGAIGYGGRVPDCSTRFGVRKVTGRAILYEGLNTALTVADTGRLSGTIPYQLTGEYAGDPAEIYEGRFGITIVINGGKSLRKPKKPERWKDPGKGCRVMTTRRAGDTLGCTLATTVQPG